MKNEIKAALIDAQATAVMIVENYFAGDYTPERIDALNAIAKAQTIPHPGNACKAQDAALSYLCTIPEIAMTLINERMAARAVKSPLAESAQRALRGED